MGGLADALAARSVDIAPRMLGSILFGRGVAIRLTEVEAYLGTGEDPGSHAHRGRTPRTGVMFGPPARLYVYRSYGIHACANVVASPDGEASAVLLRAGEVIDGLDLARDRRPTARTDAELARGPGRLTLSLGIRLDDDGADLETGDLRLELATEPPSAYSTGPRTGVSGHGGTDAFPLRFWIPGDPTVSPYRASIPRRR